MTRRRNYPVVRHEIGWSTLKPLLRDSFFALLAPLIILSGVIFGVVTLVEVSVLAILYILVVSLFVYRTVRLRDILEIFTHSAVFSSSIMVVFAVVGLYQYIVAYEQLGERLGVLLASWELNRFWFLLLVNVFFLIMGCIQIGRASCRERVCQYV